MIRKDFAYKIKSLQQNDTFKIGTYKFYFNGKYYVYNNNRLENDFLKAKDVINNYWFIVSILEEK